jgi:hypothetical protein
LLTDGGGNEAAIVQEAAASSTDKAEPLHAFPPFAPVIARPRVEASTFGEKVVLRWTSVPGLAYQVQISTDLVSWVNQGSPRLAAESSDSVLVQNSGTAAFFRVIQMP